jgi:hypothetical protein
MEPQTQVKLPTEFTDYVQKKANQNGGRPHFLCQIAKSGKDPEEELLNILEFLWLKNRTVGSMARKYKTTYHTIYRIVQDIERMKEEITLFLKLIPRRKVFFNRDSETSDYETVQAYIKHAERVELKTWKELLGTAEKVWRALKYKDPARWNVDEVLTFLRTIPEGSGRSGFFDAVRQVAPQFKDPQSPDYFSTNSLRSSIPRRKKDIFFKEVKMILDCLQLNGLTFHATIFKLHVALGCREGSKDMKSGICGLTWARFKDDFTLVDLYETKVKKGIWWRNCPTDLIFPDLPGELNQLWHDRGKPEKGRILLGHYPELLNVYKEIRATLKQFYKGKLKPNLLKELTSLKPHDSDKIHCNLLFEAGASVEDIAGEYKGGNEGSGNMGRGWLDINTIWKYYLTYSARSQRFQKKKRQVKTFCQKTWQDETPELAEVEAIAPVMSPARARK